MDKRDLCKSLVGKAAAYIHPCQLFRCPRRAESIILPGFPHNGLQRLAVAWVEGSQHDFFLHLFLSPICFFWMTLEKMTL